jgi:hydroxymethylpyrimidine pyrophosphatase-like HAD family hydrolase
MGDKILILFDLDDTVTPKGQHMQDFMFDKLSELKGTGRFNLAVLTTTGQANMMNQLVTESGRNAIPIFDYLLAENGLVAFQVVDGQAELLDKKTIIDAIPTDIRVPFFSSAKTMIDDVITNVGGELQSIAEEQSRESPSIAEFLNPSNNPKQVLLKVAAFNFTPIGTNKQREGYNAYRAAFKKINTGNAILEPLRQDLEERWNKIPNAPKLEFTVGGSTGVDANPPPWNKTYGYEYMKRKINPSKVYFFGDNAIKPTGNDFKVCKAVMEEQCEFCCVKVRSPSDTANYLTLLIEGVDLNAIEGKNDPQSEDEIKRQLCNMFNINNITPVPEECSTVEVKVSKGGRRKRTKKRRRKRKKRKSRKHRKRKTKHKRKHKKKHRRTRRR